MSVTKFICESCGYAIASCKCGEPLKIPDCLRDQHNLNDELKEQIKSLEAKNAELRETIHNAKEIYVGMEGFTARTAPEGYLQRILEQMYSELTGQDNK